VICSGKERFFIRLVYNAQKAYKIELNAASIPDYGSLARETLDCRPGFFAFWGSVLIPSASRSDAMAAILALNAVATTSYRSYYDDIRIKKSGFAKDVCPQMRLFDSFTFSSTAAATGRMF